MLCTGATFVKKNSCLVARIVWSSRSASIYFPYFRAIPVQRYWAWSQSSYFTLMSLLLYLSTKSGLNQWYHIWINHISKSFFPTLTKSIVFFYYYYYFSEFKQLFNRSCEYLFWQISWNLSQRMHVLVTHLSYDIQIFSNCKPY